MSQPRETAAAAAVQASTPTGMQGMVRVLVVDNDIVHARTMGEVLSRLDYQVVVVGSGTEGARKIEQDSFDVVVTDLPERHLEHDLAGLLGEGRAFIHQRGHVAAAAQNDARHF